MTSLGSSTSTVRPHVGSSSRRSSRSAARRPISNVGCATAVIAGLDHAPSTARRRRRRARRRAGSRSSRLRSTCHACSASRLFAAKIAVGCSLVEQLLDPRLGVRRVRRELDDQAAVDARYPRRVARRGSPARRPASVVHVVSRHEQPDPRVPEPEQVRRRVAGAALVVDHDRVARRAWRGGGRPRRPATPRATSRSRGRVRAGVMITPGARIARNVRAPASSSPPSLLSPSRSIW